MLNSLVRIENFEGEGVQIEVLEDCRQFFRPLTLPKAMRVNSISWPHNGVSAFNNFIRDGIRIGISPVADPTSITPATLVVAMEVPLLINGERGSISNSRTAPDISFILDGEITFINPATILWRSVRLQIDSQSSRAESQVEQIIQYVRNSFLDRERGSEPNRYLIRIVLKGHKIWSASSNPRLYLDGQVFGQPTSSLSNEPTLILPSGDGDRASDFESWFYLARPIVLITFSISFPKEVAIGETIQATVSLNGPAPTGGVPVYVRVTTPTASDPVSFSSPVTVPANSTSATFIITGGNVSNDTDVTLAGSLENTSAASSITDSLRVISLPILRSLTLDLPPNRPERSVSGGTSVVATVTLSKAAPRRGALIRLMSSNSLASLRSNTITVPSGATQVSFEIQTPVSNPFRTGSYPDGVGQTGGEVRISATYRERSQSTTFGVNYLI